MSQSQKSQSQKSQSIYQQQTSQKDSVLEWLAFHVSWMMFQYFLAEDTGIDMGINLSGTNILMAKQSLDDTQVGTSFE